MPQRVCPWWLGYLLANPLRRLLQDPRKVLAPYVREGMTVLEPGPGMGFFTLELARLVGPSGRVVAVDIQPRMLAGLRRRAARAGLLERVDPRLASPETLGLADLAGAVDFTPALAVVHELPAVEPFFAEIAQASKPGAGLLMAEPTGHVKRADFEAELQAATRSGFELVGRPLIRRSLAALLTRTNGRREA
ncbi:MAG TPA: methyltransferase domain-containing protein [Terriglobia bacterium]|nr:methyltransferase domain-containing protein [Terriglobia bacterium]